MTTSEPVEDLPATLQRRLDAARAVGGDMRFLEALTTAPHLATFYFDQFYHDIFYHGIAPVRTKELVRLRLSNLHGCAT